MPHSQMMNLVKSILFPITFLLGLQAHAQQLPDMYYSDKSVASRPYAKDPYVIFFQGKYWMYYSVPDSLRNQWHIGIATSKDLTNWQKLGDILPEKNSVEAKGICAPSALIKDGMLHLFYQTYGNGKADAICHASSKDGINFQRNPTNPIFHPTVTDWTCGRAIDAEVIAFKNQYFLYYATRDTAYKIQQQGVAVAELNTDFSRNSWKEISGMPMLKPELDWEKSCIEAASCIQKGDELFMFYAGGYNNEPQQIGVARSKDGIHWKRLSDKPFLTNGAPGSWNESESGHPKIFNAEDGKYYLFFQGNNDKGKTWYLSKVAIDWKGDTPVVKTKKDIWLDDLPIQTFSEGMRPVSAKSNYAHDTMQMNGVYYSRGVGAQSPCVMAFLLDGHAKRFTALVGADEKGNKDIPLSFYVVGDKKVLFEVKDMRMGDAPMKVDVDLTGIKRLGLLITDKVGGVNNKRTYGNWADAKLEMADEFSPAYIPNSDKKYILTPTASKKPRINSPKLFGATPGNPFLYTIAATGERPMQFSVDHLPKGLVVSAKTGIISGSVKEKGIYQIWLTAKNKLGEATQKLVVKIGDTIALTPPLGWNGWNAWEQKLDREKVIASANAMVSKGLRDHGWSYINIDDSWQGIRTGPDTALQPNAKFPDIKKMVEDIHSIGLRVGIYSTPYISSYAKYVGGSSDYPAGGEKREDFLIKKPTGIGKYRFERNDAKQMADWGFDFLKYDWRIDVESTQRMSEALKQSGRDIIFSLSNNAPFEKVSDWAKLSNMYRTGPDIKDSWTSLFLTTFSLNKWAPFTGPGHWADPDMMILGDVSIGPVLHPTRLTPDEQYSHVSIFSLLSAPMLIGCPIEKVDSFTLNLLTNDEVIAVNQDPLGKPAQLVLEDDGVQVWLKTLEEGSYAVGLFNIDGFQKTPQSYFRWGDEKARDFVLNLKKLGLTGKWKIRDIWQQKNLGLVNEIFKTSIHHHGVVMLKLMESK